MKLAIIGTGMIVGEALKALKFIPSIKVTAIYVRPGSLEKTRTLIETYQIKEVYTDYDELLRECDADFVYVGNVNSVHYEYGRKALLSGKHVIMEKPMCVTHEEASDLMQLAIAKRRYVFEAVTFLHAPFFRLIRERLTVLGNIRLVQCNYSKYSSRYDRYLKGDVAPAFSPEHAGGALMDLNVYNLNFVVALFGKPMKTFYTAHRGFNGIDTSGTVLMAYGNFTATCTAAKDSYSPCFFMVQGEKGWLRVNGSPDDLSYMEIGIDGKVEKISIETESHRMVDEFQDFYRMYHDGCYDEMKQYLQNSVDIAATVDEAQQSLRALPI